MKQQNSRLFRIWTDVTGLLLPLLALTLYVLDGPSALTMALTLVCLGAIFGTWAVTTGLRGRRARRVARLRRRLRRARA